MITDVKLFDGGSAVQDPRRKSQSMLFKNSLNIPKGKMVVPHGVLREQTPKQSALYYSISAVFGSLLFLGAFMIATAMRRV